MHCPYCNAELRESEHKGNLECSYKHSLFGPAISAKLKEIYGEHKSSSDGNILEIKGFYCPGCGVKLENEGCPICKLNLSKNMAFNLIEFNPHVKAT
jgi:acetone carboxylase gamma subunit